jgi:hypothetical protein
MRPFILLFPFLGLVPAADLSMVPSAESVSVGQTVTVQVRLARRPTAVSAAQVRLDFDRSRLAYAGIAGDAAATDTTVNDSPATINSRGSLRALIDYPDGAAAGDRLLTVTFTAIAGGAASVTAVPPAQPYGCRIADGTFAVVALALPTNPTIVAIASTDQVSSPPVFTLNPVADRTAIVLP